VFYMCEYNVLHGHYNLIRVWWISVMMSNIWKWNLCLFKIKTIPCPRTTVETRKSAAPNAIGIFMVSVRAIHTNDYMIQGINIRTQTTLQNIHYKRWINVVRHITRTIIWDSLKMVYLSVRYGTVWYPTW
jgi:hypothetical protein